MEKLTFRIKVRGVDGNPTTKTVHGYKVELEGFEEFNFGIHKLEYRWTISELSTGYTIMPSSWPGGLSNSTRKGAVQIAILYLRERGSVKFVETLAILPKLR